ncbi:copper amine oxidase N-terminal domain-containing protein [Ammoniphilus sp. 3BR4]|uniref:copper amine oxidase N-terminal domain-containing protein n=1 Tax=Ammoniphilus sp. 3BR4 TaxID=3158265 RepID=UPI003465A80B
MKKKLFIGVALALSLIGGSVYAATGNLFKGFPIVNVHLDGEAVHGDVPAISLDGRTLVPVRLISEALGADVSWDQSTSTVNITQNNTVAYFQAYAKVITDELDNYGIELSSFNVNVDAEGPYLSATYHITNSADLKKDLAMIAGVSSAMENPETDEFYIWLESDTESMGHVIISLDVTRQFIGNEQDLEDFVKTWNIEGVKGDVLK